MSDSSIPPEDDFLLLDDAPLDFETNGPPKATISRDDDSDIETNLPFEEATVQVGDRPGGCVVCGAPVFRPPGLTASGKKKRTPRHCDLHDPKRNISYERPQPKGMESQLQRVQDEIADEIRLIAALAGPLLPVTGFFLFEHADPFTIALLKLFKNNQNVLKILHRAAQIAPVYTVGETIAGTVYSIQVDNKRADPHTVVGQRLGVARAYDQVYPNDINTPNSNNGFQAAPKYATT